jgi:hypothetical protein
MSESRTLAKLAATAQRMAEGMNALQHTVNNGPCSGTVARQAIAVVEEFDLLRFHIREATLRRAILPAEPEPAPATGPATARAAVALAIKPAKRASPRSARKPPAKGKAKR